MRKKWFSSVMVLFLLLLLLGLQEMNAFPDHADHDFEGINAGRQYLVLIAIDQYLYWKGLGDPKNKIGPTYDAQRLKAVLNEHYHFDNIQERYNQDATRQNILNLLNGYKRLKPSDTLFIYYSGHGTMDKKTDEGYWIPYDSVKSDQTKVNWLANSKIRDLIKRIGSDHILIVSDSCFAGTLFDYYKGKDTTPENLKVLRTIYPKKACKVMTAGDKEEVRARSVFADLFIKALEKNENGLFVRMNSIYNYIYKDIVKLTGGEEKGNNPLYGDMLGVFSKPGSHFILFTKDGWKKLVEKFRRPAYPPVPGSAEFFLANGIRIMNKGEIDIAESQLKKVFTRKPDKTTLTNTYKALGILYLKKGLLNKNGFLNKAINELNKALEIDPYCMDAYNYLGVIYTEKREYGKAKEKLLCAAQSKRYHSKEIAYTNLALLEMRQGNLEAALRYTAKGIRENRHFAELYNLNGMIYEEKGQYYQSIDNYKKALDAPDRGDLNEVSCLMNLGRAYAKDGSKDEALDYLEKALVQANTPDLKNKINALMGKIQND